MKARLYTKAAGDDRGTVIANSGPQITPQRNVME